MIVRILIVVFASLSIAQYLKGVPLGNTTREDLDSLLAWTEGTFSNAIQARVDSSFDRISIWSKRIWTSRLPGGWFFVRVMKHDSMSVITLSQQVYHVNSIEEGMFEVTVYAMSDEMANTDPVSAEIEQFSAHSLTQRRGCELYLQAADRTFIGGTHGTACASTVQGASYTTAELLISPQGLWWLERTYAPGGEAVGRLQTSAYALLREKQD